MPAFHPFSTISICESPLNQGHFAPGMCDNEVKCNKLMLKKFSFCHFNEAFKLNQSLTCSINLLGMKLFFVVAVCACF